MRVFIPFMTGTGEWPFGVTPDNYPEFMGRCDEHIVRKGKDMAGYFMETPDPERVIYEVYESKCVGYTCMAITVLKPGKVGKEYHMTKGHFHEDPKSGELYFCLKGRGMVIMQTREGDTAEVRLQPGAAISIPPGWAHRTVNVGEDDFIMLAVFPACAGHDYGSIEKNGFIKRVVDGNGEPQII